MPRSAALLATLAIVVGACGSGDAADDTLPAPTTAPRPTDDARLDPDDIVITDGDTVPDPVAMETDDGDADPATAATEPAESSDADTAGADPDAAGTDADPGAGSPRPEEGTGAGDDPTTGTDAGFTTAEEIPDEWPDDVPPPTGLTDIAATVFEDSVEYTIVVTGIPSGDPTAYVAGYLAAARAAGFETSSVIEDDRQVYSFVAERDGWFLSAASTAVGGVEEVVVALTRNL